MSGETICTGCRSRFYSNSRSLTEAPLCQECDGRAMLNPSNPFFWEAAQATFGEFSESEYGSLPDEEYPSGFQPSSLNRSISHTSLAEVNLELIHGNEEEITRLREERDEQAERSTVLRGQLDAHSADVAELRAEPADHVSVPEKVIREEDSGNDSHDPTLEIVGSKSGESPPAFQAVFSNQILVPHGIGGEPRNSLSPVNHRHPTLAALQPKARMPSRTDSTSSSSYDSDEEMAPITPSSRILSPRLPRLCLDIRARPCLSVTIPDCRQGPVPAEDYVPRPEPIEPSLPLATQLRFTAMLAVAAATRPAATNTAALPQKPTSTTSTADVPRGSSAVTTTGSNTRAGLRAARGGSNFSRPSTKGSTTSSDRPAAVSSSTTRGTTGRAGTTSSSSSSRGPPVFRNIADTLQRSERIGGPRLSPGLSSRPPVSSKPRTSNIQRASSQSAAPAMVRGTRASNLRRQVTARPGVKPLPSAPTPPPTRRSTASPAPRVLAEVVAKRGISNNYNGIGKSPPPRPPISMSKPQGQTSAPKYFSEDDEEEAEEGETIFSSPAASTAYFSEGEPEKEPEAKSKDKPEYTPLEPEVNEAFPITNEHYSQSEEACRLGLDGSGNPFAAYSPSRKTYDAGNHSGKQSSSERARGRGDNYF